MSLGARCGALVGCVILKQIAHGEEIGVRVSGAQNIAQGVEWRAHRVSLGEQRLYNLWTNFFKY
jgi:hypothetical protein